MGFGSQAPDDPYLQDGYSAKHDEADGTKPDETSPTIRAEELLAAGAAKIEEHEKVIDQAHKELGLPITVSSLRESLQRMEAEGHGDLPVWTVHPQWGIQWGPILGIGTAITDRFEQIALIDPRGGEADRESMEPEEKPSHDPQAYTSVEVRLRETGVKDIEHFVEAFKKADIDPLCSWSPSFTLTLETSPSILALSKQWIEMAKQYAPAQDVQPEQEKQMEAVTGNGDTHVAGEGEKWAFDEKVTGVFDKMLEASIPNYREMRRLTFALGRRFIPKDKAGVIMDIGASRGDALAPFVEQYPDHNYYAIEISEPMRAVMQERFGHLNNVTICDHDLRYNHSAFEVKSDLILSVLTLMFVPIELRQRLVQSMYDSLKPGGALILVEKCLGNDPYMQDMLVEEYLGMKREHGYTHEQIYRKKLALEGVLVPMAPRWNIEMMELAGFKHIETYWKSLMFTGFIAIK